MVRPGPPAWASPAALGVAAAASVGALARPPETNVAWSLAWLGVGFAALAVLVACERRRPGLDRRLVLVVSGALVVLAVVVPPRRSTDVWAYAGYGRIVAHHHASPYTHAAEDFPDDPVTARVAERWQDSPSVYGPVFVGLAAAGMAVAGTSALVARLWFQVLAAAAVVAALVLVDRRTRDPMAVAFLGVNPLTIVSVVNGGHNDALVGLAVLGAVLLVLDRRPGWAGAAAGAGVLVKVGGLLPLGVLAAWALVHQGATAGLVLGGVGGGLVLAGLAAAGGVSVLSALSEASLRFTRGSVWWRVREWLASGPSGPADLDAAGRRVSTAAGAAVAALAALLAAPRLRSASPALAVIACVLAYMLLGSYVTPWYVAWSLPVLALCWRSRLAWVAVGHAGLLLLTSMPRRIPDGEPFRGVVVWLYGAGIPLVEVVLVGALAWASWRALRGLRGRDRAGRGSLAAVPPS